MLFDSTSLSRDPNLTNPLVGQEPFAVQAGNLKDTHESPEGQKLETLLCSRFAVAALVGAVAAAPSKPPHPAVELLLQSELGDIAFDDRMKQLTGRIVRQLIEYLGGTYIRKGVPVTVESRYRKGAIYEFPAFARKPRVPRSNIVPREGTVIEVRRRDDPRYRKTTWVEDGKVITKTEKPLA